jgi:hypothetical protein
MLSCFLLTLCQDGPLKFSNFKKYFTIPELSGLFYYFLDRSLELMELMDSHIVALRSIQQKGYCPCSAPLSGSAVFNRWEVSTLEPSCHHMST